MNTATIFCIPSSILNNFLTDLISAVKRLIVINRIQNKFLFT